MLYDQLLKNPRAAAADDDLWIKRLALSCLIKNPKESDRPLLESLAQSRDARTAFSAVLGLRELFPQSVRTRKISAELFSDAVEILAQRSCSGPLQLRSAALRALIFDKGHLSYNRIAGMTEALELTSGHEIVYTGRPQTMARIAESPCFMLQDGFGALMAALPAASDRSELLKRELKSSNSARKEAALISLQILPDENLTDDILPLVREPEGKTAEEAIKALIACGGSKVYLLLISLLKDTKDIHLKSVLLPLAAATGREEALGIIRESAESQSADLVKAAVYAANTANFSHEDKLSIYKKCMKSSFPGAACLAAAYGRHEGSLKAVKILERNMESSLISNRISAAEAYAEADPDIAISALTQAFEEERNGDVMRQIILSLRSLLALFPNNNYASDRIKPWLERQLGNPDSFKRTQTAVLCGILGSNCENILLNAAEQERNPYVLSSIIEALHKCCCSKFLLYTRFCSHEDHRVRSAALEALPAEGSFIQYFAQARKDESPRVRAAGLYKLYLLGQTEVIKEAASMVEIPEPEVVLAGCYALEKMLSVQISLLQEDHPLVLALTDLDRRSGKRGDRGPFFFVDNRESASVFTAMANGEGSKSKICWILEEQNRIYPSSYPVRRMLASVLASLGEYQRASSLINLCLADNPGSLADWLDAYRIAIKAGEIQRANRCEDKLKKLYSVLYSACWEICRSLPKPISEPMEERLNKIVKPSMNLYNIMVRLKIIEKDSLGTQDLLTEVLLARPYNGKTAIQLADQLSKGLSGLKEALILYAGSLEQRK